MTHDELMQALDGLRVDTWSLACLGCGYEDGCSVYGCAVLRAARAELEAGERRAAQLSEALAMYTREAEKVQARLEAELEQTRRERDAAISGASVNLQSEDTVYAKA